MRRAKEYPHDPIRQAWYDYRTKHGIYYQPWSMRVYGYQFKCDGDVIRCGDQVVEDHNGPVGNCDPANC